MNSDIKKLEQEIAKLLRTQKQVTQQWELVSHLLAKVLKGIQK